MRKTWGGRDNTTTYGDKHGDRKTWESVRKRERHSPRWAVDAEAPDGNIRVLQVDAVGEQGLNVLVVLRLEFGGWRKVVEILLYQVCHKLLIECQLVVPSYNDFYLVGQSAWGKRKQMSWYSVFIRVMIE